MTTTTPGPGDDWALDLAAELNYLRGYFQARVDSTLERLDRITQTPTTTTEEK